MKRLLNILLVFVMLFSSVSCSFDESKKENSAPSTDNEQNQDLASNKLEILKSDNKLTQEQKLSRIKAEYLIENKGYKADDEVTVMVTLKDNALIDNFNDKYNKTSRSVAEYASTFHGKMAYGKIEDAQFSVIRALNDKNLIKDVERTYSTVVNAISVRMEYGKIEDVKKIEGVEGVILNDTYNLPKVAPIAEYSAVENSVDVYKTGIYNSSSVKYTGKGTSVAVLDSGFDCSHSVFQNNPERPHMDMESIKKVMANPDFQAMKTTPDLEVTDVYRTAKIPFAYDYADKDSDVFPYDSHHGTHVAGIIGGKDNEITGVAVDTQLVLMKVFPDLDSGAETDDIIAALEDSVLLDVDAINMSLGSSCGFVREVDKVNVNKIYDKINETGISLITAASNSYSAAFGGEQGNTNMVTNPDSGTVGAPSTYNAALSVASISGVKSRYLVANGEQVVFYDESSKINGKPNDFYKDLGLDENSEKTIEYVTIPGVGLHANYKGEGYKEGDLEGKIVLVRRGNNTFEEKAKIAKQYGALGCIIYNNIDGEIRMSMGKQTDYIPTISISKDNGMRLAERKKGTLFLSGKNMAGPFMSDFSSWGPTPSLELKPEITAHGGNIHSAVPGGGYEDMSGTSMATPNLCGVVVLIRQYLKDKYPEKPAVEIKNLVNQIMMSTATIALNEEGNPYSPRKQGAGLASLYNAVNTDAYITVDGKDRTKLELKDDPNRTGIYKFDFNVKNIGNEAVSYDLTLIGMTESVSKYDEKHVAETPHILQGKCKFYNGKEEVTSVTVAPGEEVKVTGTYTLTDKDKDRLNRLFPYGMYVEGFVKLTNKNGEKVNLNIPFLAFYGDWTEAPIFDKTFYEVESEAYDGGIDEEDKIKADYYATTPYGSYFHNYMIPLGKYIYGVDKDLYDVIPGSTDRIALSDTFGALDGFSTVYAGLLRNAKSMRYTITDKITGEIVYDLTDYNGTKAYSEGAGPRPYFKYLKKKSADCGLVNNRQYEFKMFATLDYGKDGGASNNVRNQFAFDFYMDNEAPVLKEVTYEKKYDRTLKKDRYYINMVVYDNHYVQSITPIVFTSNKSYTFLSENPIPVYGERGEDTKVRFEITDYLEEIEFDKIITNGLSFSIDDYALNSNIFVCQLPGTKGEFKFTNDGTPNGREIHVLSLDEGKVVNLTNYLATKDKTVDADKDYLKYLTWTSSDESIAKVSEGLIKCIKPGKVTVTATERMNGQKATIIINIRSKKNKVMRTFSDKDKGELDNYEDAKLKSVRFSHFETLFAFPPAAGFSEIGKTGDLRYVSAMGKVDLYPGEKIKLFPDIDPWYAEDKYADKFEYVTGNKKYVTVNQDGEVMALEKGATTVTLKVKGSNLSATIKINVKSPFIIENRMLISYKGLGGDVVIPDDEGILYIAPYAFCLYNTDQTIELPEDDYDLNKIPTKNNTIKSIVIPDGVEDIQKYAFYNCTELESVVIPQSAKFLREFAFYNDNKLKTVDLKNIMVVGANAFAGCTSLTNIKMDKIFAIGEKAFDGCTALYSTSLDPNAEPVFDLTNLRSTGKGAFRGCTALKDVKLGEFSKLSVAMFARSGLESIDIYEKDIIPEFCFAQCKNLIKVVLHNDLVSIEKGAFSECTALVNIQFKNVDYIGEQVFYKATALKEFTLPNCGVEIDQFAFLLAKNLETLKFGKNSNISEIYVDDKLIVNKFVAIFKDTNLNNFVVDSANNFYTVSSDGRFLLNKAGNKIVLASGSKNSGEINIQNYTEIGAGAFSGCNITKVTIGASVEKIGYGAFARNEGLTQVIFEGSEIILEDKVFENDKALSVVENINIASKIGNYAFAGTGLTNISLRNDAEIGEGAFFKSKLVEVSIGDNVKLGIGAFSECLSLETVNMPALANVILGDACFNNDKKLSNISLLNIVIIPNNAFYGCESLKKVDLNKATSIGKYAFSGCKALESANMPNVEIIKEGAFSKSVRTGYATSLLEVNLPKITTLEKGAFVGCEKLKTVVIGGDLKSIEKYMFLGCFSLSDVKLSQSVTEIKDFAFRYCPMLSDIKTVGIDNSVYNIDLRFVKVIGESAFQNKEESMLGGKFNGENLEKIGKNAFEYDVIESFNGVNLKEIEAGAFRNNRFTEFVFGDKIEKIGSLAFNGCIPLKNFAYMKEGVKVTDDGIINDYAKLVQGALYTKLKTNQWLFTSIPCQAEIETLNVAKGTTRVDVYAANENRNIKKVVLPDGLMLIGNHAFYHCYNLEVVEFNSVVAPALESSYNKDSDIEKDDPGYDILHNIFDLFGDEKCYYTFIDLVGKKYPIKMVLPKNEDIKGYDSIIYRTYFGELKDSERNEYIAMEENLIKFIQYSKSISKIDSITLSHEQLINDAVTVYNTLKQSGMDYGFTKEQWDNTVKVVIDSKKELSKIKLSKATQEVRDVQALIDALPTEFDINNLSLYSNVDKVIKSLKFEERSYLDLTQYNKLVEEYNKYRENLEIEMKPVVKAVDKSGYSEIIVAGALSLMTLVSVVCKKKFI